ncbi:MAG: LemA family protein [Alphaproteobacteria bacterium]|nr:LemA family protein [Alphaproteobacteria bacterium]
MIIALIVLAVIVLYIISVYNKLKRTQQHVKEAWSNIDTHLKRRYDLIPNLVETVKGYAKHEAETLKSVIEARNMAINNQAAGAEARAKDENALSGALKSVFALSESYPELKADQNYLNLQKELVDTEDKIQAARSFYNTSVLSLNTQVDTFPSNIIAGQLGVKKEAFFELDEAERKVVQEAPKVSF